MSIEFGGTPASIDPYLNPAYWNGRFIGDGTARSWPELGEAGAKDLAVCVAALTLYAKQGARRLALSRLHSGDVFDASNHDPGTILLTLAEHLSPAPEAEDVVPMAEFRDGSIPDRLTGIADGEHVLEGHGYRYGARPLLNIVMGRKERRVLLVPDAVVGDMPDFGNKEYGLAVYENMEPGFTEFTVGNVYNFGNNDNSHDLTLARVTEAIVCAGVVRGGGALSPKTLLTKKLSGLFSPATGPTTP
jgi:hypothetical protein